MGDDEIWIETMVSHRTGEPIVTLRWYDHSAQLTPQETRRFAFQVLEAASVAESDAFLVDFFKTKLGIELDRAASILQEFRNYREERERETEG